MKNTVWNIKKDQKWQSKKRKTRYTTTGNEL